MSRVDDSDGIVKILFMGSGKNIANPVHTSLQYHSDTAYPVHRVHSDSYSVHSDGIDNRIYKINRNNLNLSVRSDRIYSGNNNSIMSVVCSTFLANEAVRKPVIGLIKIIT